MTRFARVFALLCAAAIVPAAVFAIVPDPEESITPNCITVDPGGAVDIFVQVIGNNGQPLGGEEVRVIFNGACSDDTTLPFTGLAEDINGSCASPVVLVGNSNATTGEITFSPLIGGCCDEPQAVRIEADHGAVTLLPVYDSVSSTDWSFCSAANRSYANGTVDLSDFSAFTGEFLGSPANICYDYPTGGNEVCDGAVNLSDFSFFQGRFLSGDGDCPPCQ